MSTAIRAVTMPKWGIEMTEGTINQWVLREGERVEKGGSLLEVETDKIVNTVESPAAGVLRRIVAGAGEVIAVGALVGVLAGEEVSDADVDSFINSFRGAQVSFEPDSAASSASAAEAAASEVRVSPVARRLAEQLGLDIRQVKPAGSNGRVTKEDVENYAAGLKGTATPAGTAASSADATHPDPVTRVRLSATRLTIARRLSQSSQAIPHYRVSIDIDAAPLQQLRRALSEDQRGARVTLNDVLLRVCALGLVRHPAVNALLEGEETLQYAHAHIAIAVPGEAGLITPIIRNADQKSIVELARESAELIGRARRSELTREQINGGTFSVSNLGMYGVSRFDAIINPPQVAILAIGAARQTVVVRDGEPAVGELMTLTLSADHRVVDGAQAAAFLATLASLAAAPQQL
jgi:pyruvate dehydrogenase E2 component (dihydrolipoamide acetyltransferase)